MSEEKSRKVVELILFRVVPLLISVTAITLSIISFYGKRKEDINISITRESGDYKTNIIKVDNDKKFPARIEVRFNILLINNSERTVTFGSYKVEELTGKELENYGQNVCSLNIKDGDLIKKAEFPFSVDAGKTKKLQIIMGLKIAKKPYEILKENFKNLSNISMRDIKKVLLDHKTDIYGNKLLIHSKNENAISYNYGYENPLTQRFMFSLKTIRKNTFASFF